MTATATFKPTEAVITEAYAAFNNSLPQVKNVTKTSWALNLEPLPPYMYGARGGSDANALGLTGEGGRPLVVCLILPLWPDANQNEQVYSAVRAKALRVHDPYIYLDYAAPWQEAISNDSTVGVARLRHVRDTYDPNRAFKKQFAGGFKILGEQVLAPGAEKTGRR
ncbi:hypothetical protein F5X98DRAFT_376892 [Xylaria grammica]|nr:hypothetical protein F5X98DRAFT_376892 [Xylaria grammica]